MDAQVIPSPEALLATVNEIEPLILAERDNAEKNRRMSANVANELRRRGFFRLYRPQERCGFGLDPVAGFRIVEELSRIDSAVGWNVAISNAADGFGAWFSNEATTEIFATPDTVVAGGLFPPRKAQPVEGGYLVSGKSLFNSNCHAANWLLVESIIYDGEEQRLDAGGNPVGLIMFVPASEARIVDNWETLGMRGTGSHDVELQEVFVPHHRAAALLPLEKADTAYSGPMHRLGIWPLVAINGVPALGIAQASLDDFIDLAVNKIPAYTTKTLRDRTTVQLRYATAEAKLRAARTYLYNTFDRLWSTALAGEFITTEQKADCQQAASHAIMASAEVVDLIHSIASSAAIRNDKPFQRHFRDIHVITQHAFVCESRLEAVGQIRLGLESDWEFLYF